MKLLSRLKIRTKLASIVVLASLVICAIIAIAASLNESRMLADRTAQMRTAVDLLYGMAQTLQDEVVAGKMTQAEAVAFFEKEEVTIGPIYDISQIVEDPHFQQREIVVEVPDEDMGHVAVQGIVARLSGTPGRFFRPAPKLGEHNEEALGWSGLSSERLDQIRAGGAIRLGSRKSPQAVADAKGVEANNAH